MVLTGGCSATVAKQRAGQHRLPLFKTDASYDVCRVKDIHSNKESGRLVIELTNRIMASTPPKQKGGSFQFA